jgi:hypothetical protein
LSGALSAHSCEHLSAHFTLGELSATSQRDAHGKLLSNYPVPDDVKRNLIQLCLTILERIRIGYGGRLHEHDAPYRHDVCRGLKSP